MRTKVIVVLHVKDFYDLVTSCLLCVQFCARFQRQTSARKMRNRFGSAISRFSVGELGLGYISRRTWFIHEPGFRCVTHGEVSISLSRGERKTSLNAPCKQYAQHERVCESVTLR